MKKNFLKRTCVLISLAMLMATFAFTASAKRFTDINYGRQFFDDINYVVDNGIMNGTSSTVFSPNEKITRAMLIAVLYNKEGRPSTSAANPFKDVSSSDYYYNAVRWAHSNKIVSGTSGSAFNPEQKITREDTAVFLYRYARYKGYDITKTLSLSSVTDYSSIESYARTPVAWIMASRIVLGGCKINDNGTTANGTFEPKEQVTRAECARIVVRFGLMAEGILMKKDAYSFINSSDNFVNSVRIGQYYITTPDFDALKQKVITLYGKESKQFERMEELQALTWNGSCYGMAVTTILDKIGKIDLNGNYSSASTMYGMSSPKNNPALESAINYYHLIQSVTPGSLDTYIIQDHVGIGKLLTSLDKNGVVLFSYTDKNDPNEVGHAIVLYDYIKNDNGSYTIKAYDNNKANENITLTIPAAKNAITVNLGYAPAVTVKDSWIIDNYSYYDLFDIDGYYNDNTFTSVSSLAAFEDPFASYTRLYVSAGSDFTITNAEGETLIRENGDFSGSMNLVKKSIVVNGLDTPVEWVLYVEPSASFTCETENETCDFHLLSTEAYMGLYSQGAREVTLANDEEISFAGEQVQYKATLSLKTEGIIQMSGEGESAGFFGWQDDELAAKSQNGCFDVSVRKDLQVLDTQSFVSQNNQIYIDINENKLLEKKDVSDCMDIYTKIGNDKLPFERAK
ncbi:MAG: S-layer homology domain-containing protein [Clostridiales bacterium]|nr:S-layer homology domain-containing protein [Clostridiales bacterium]